MEKLKRRKPVYACAFLKVYEDDVTLPNGKETKRVVIDHDGAASVLPLTKDNQVILVKQYRYASGDYFIEIPAGKKDSKDEPGLVCAKRELEEETGYGSSRFEKIGEIYTAIGFTNEMIELFVALDVEKVENPLPAEEDEFLEVFSVPFEEAVKMVIEGKITDAKSVVSILKWDKQNFWR